MIVDGTVRSSRPSMSGRRRRARLGAPGRRGRETGSRVNLRRDAWNMVKTLFQENAATGISHGAQGSREDRLLDH
jgi:hypothetical protein